MAGGYELTLDGQVSASTADVTDVDSVITHPAIFCDLGLFTDDAVVHSNDSAGCLVSSRNDSLAVRSYGDVAVAIVPMALELLWVVRLVDNVDVVHLGE